ncbi:hypothetical protein ACW9UR_19670 [Halovulum sp. GXIMD14794]
MRLTTMAAAVVALFAPVAAKAQFACAPRADLIESLAQSHGEQLTSGGLSGPGKLVEIWTGEDGSWTILLTDAAGTSCIMAAGQDWIEFPMQPEGLPASAG